jgi:hypothetical protein
MITNGLLNEPVPIVKWELAFQQIDQNIYEAKDRAFIGALFPSDIRVIEEKLRTSDETTPPYSVIANNTEGIITYDMKKAGVESRLLFIPVLKRMVIASNNWLAAKASTIGFDNTYLSKIFTTSELNAAYTSTNPLSNIPATVLAMIQPNKLPGQFVNVWGVMGNSYTTDISTSNGFAADYSTLIVTKTGWLQYPTEIQTISTLKQQMTQQWIYNRWSCDSLQGLYDSATYSAPQTFVADQQVIFPA